MLSGNASNIIWYCTFPRIVEGSSTGSLIEEKRMTSQMEI